MNLPDYFLLKWLRQLSVLFEHEWFPDQQCPWCFKLAVTAVGHSETCSYIAQKNQVAAIMANRELNP